MSQNMMLDHRVIEIDTIPQFKVQELTGFKFSCLFLNIRSLRKNWKLFFVKLLEVIQNIKVIVLVEINIMHEKKSVNDLFKIDGFDAVFYNRPRRTFGGIAVFVRKDIPYIRFVYNTIFYETIHLELTIGTRVLPLIAVYRPPSLNTDSFITELGDILSQLSEMSELCVIGDMNIDLNRQAKGFVRDYIQMNTLQGLVNVITSDTRCVIETGHSTRIEHALVRGQVGRVLSAVVESNISDHYALLCAFLVDTSARSLANPRDPSLSWIDDEILRESADDSALYKRCKINRTNESFKHEYKVLHEKFKKTINKASKGIKKRKVRPVKQTSAEF